MNYEVLIVLQRNNYFHETHPKRFCLRVHTDGFQCAAMPWAFVLNVLGRLRCGYHLRQILPFLCPQPTFQLLNMMVISVR